MAQAHTDTMDTRKTLEPVVVERPARGREMKTNEFVEKNESASSSSAEKFHEGYIGGKKYLVPDSNLEAMADMINLKMRRMESSKYVNDAGALKPISVEDNYSKKKESLFSKLDSLAGSQNDDDDDDEDDEDDDESDSSSEEEEKEDNKNNKHLDKTDKFVDESSEEEDDDDDDEEEEDDEEDDSEEDEGKLGKDGEEPINVDKSPEEEDGKEDAKEGDGVDDEDGLVPVYYHDSNVKRFLISGHFRSDSKPIYIVQQYEGPSVFQHKDPQFSSQKSEKNADIFISGEFFKESILEENLDKEPISLKTKPNKVVIDWRSRIYEEKFADVFVGSEVDVELSGSFIQHSPEALHTPLLTIMLRKGTANAPLTPDGTGQAVYVMRPIIDNLFEYSKAWRTMRRKRSEDRRKRGDYEVHGSRRTGYEYPEGSRFSGPMTVYVSQPEADSPWLRRSAEYEASGPITASKRVTLRDTIVLPETTQGSNPRLSQEEGLPTVDLPIEGPREHIKSLTRKDSQAEVLQEFVKSQRNKIRERRQKDRESITMGAILSQLFFSR